MSSTPTLVAESPLARRGASAPESAITRLGDPTSDTQGEIRAGLKALLERQRAAFIRQGPPSLDERRKDLVKLKKLLLKHQEQIIQAISQDFGHRSHHETSLFELVSVSNGIQYLHRHVARWMRPERRHVAMTFAPAKARIEYQPLGVVGIISPWNYPLALTMMPLATALAAGNRVMIKPSEVTAATSKLMREILAEQFDQEQVTVVTGDAAIGAAFAGLPFDHLLFTGSTSVGRAVLRAASENLVPATLELGGKSPVIIDRGASLATAARRIAYGKLANAGQTCIAPDYVLVPEAQVDDFVLVYREAILHLYPHIASNPDYTSIVSDRQHARLLSLLADAREKGARVLEVGVSADDRARTHARTLNPVVVLDTSDDMTIMSEEIFGPLLPIIPYREVKDAVDYINARPRPLALYYFGPKGPDRDFVLQRTTSGGVSINETNLHYAQDDLPFGGVGPGGMGAYHGPEGFKAMSHAKGVFEQASLNLTDLIRPPFGKLIERVVNFMLR
jgi:coniferyl-aldehyde dehydrogenase